MAEHLTPRERLLIRRFSDNPIDFFTGETKGWLEDFLKTSSPTGAGGGGSGAQTGDYKMSAQTATHTDGTGTWYLCDGSAFPAEEADLIVLVGSNAPDARGRTLVMVGTHPTVNLVGENEGIGTVANRSPYHNTSVLTNPTAANPTQATTTQANPTQATTTQANPTQATTTQATTTQANPTQATTTQANPTHNLTLPNHVHSVDHHASPPGVQGSTAIEGSDTAANTTKNTNNPTTLPAISGVITAGTITNGAITAGAITNGAITNGAITAGTITNGAITAGVITNGAITAGAISGGVYGPSGTNPINTAAFVVPGNLFIHS